MIALADLVVVDGKFKKSRKYTRQVKTREGGVLISKLVPPGIEDITPDEARELRDALVGLGYKYG